MGLHGSSEGEPFIKARSSEDAFAQKREAASRNEVDIVEVEFYSRLINQAPYIPGDAMELIPITEIPWYNPALFKEGIEFGIRNFFALLIANTAALMFGFSVKPDSAVLLRSGKFHTQEKSWLRYLSTGARIGSWYRTDLSNPESEGYKQIKAVRKLHAFYAKSKEPFPSLEEMGYSPDKKEFMEALRKDLAYVDVSEAPQHLLTWSPPLQFSQFDVAMTQFGFIALIYLYPAAIGIPDNYPTEGFLHFWAVIGRCMGLEDRFNLALHPNRSLMRKLYYNVAIASLSSSDETVVCLQTALMEALGRRVPWLTLKGWVYYGLHEECDGFEGTEMWGIMGSWDRLSYYCIKGLTWSVRKSALVRYITNAILAVLIHLAFYFYLPKGCPAF